MTSDPHLERELRLNREATERCAAAAEKLEGAVSGLRDDIGRIDNRVEHVENRMTFSEQRELARDAKRMPAVLLFLLCAFALGVGGALARTFDTYVLSSHSRS